MSLSVTPLTVLQPLLHHAAAPVKCLRAGECRPTHAPTISAPNCISHFRASCSVPFAFLGPFPGRRPPAFPRGLPRHCLSATCWRPLLYSAIRVGEALHPGPSQQSCLDRFFGRPAALPVVPLPARSDSCVFAVANPTSVLHKVPLFLQTDVLALSETSAVAAVQRATQLAFCRHKFKVHWGLPVPCHAGGNGLQPSLRGLAAGVALASRLPSRASRPALPDSTTATCRLSEAFVRLGALEVRVITIYGYPLSQSDARQGTQDLLALAAERATQNAVPCIIAGDFNMPPLDLPAGEALAAIGYQEVFSLHLKLHGVQLPPTCKGATRNDTALLHPLLVPLFQEAWVLSDKQLFDAHDPLCFRLTMCSQRPCRSAWRLPRPWSELGLSKRAFQRAFQPAVADLTVQAQNCASTADVDASLLAFSSCGVCCPKGLASAA